MVKTRHSDDLSPKPHFLSLTNGRQSRHLTQTTNDSGDGLLTSMAYNTDGSNAFNIFDDKTVESRLRPRTGPSRAYNYLDVESSEEESRYRSRRRSGQRDLSPEQMGGSAHRLRQRQIKSEMLEEELHDRRARHSRTSMQRLRDEMMESDKSDLDETLEREVERTHSSSPRGRRNAEDNSLSRERESRQVNRRRESSPVEEGRSTRQLRHARSKMSAPKHDLSDEEQEDVDENDVPARVLSSRQRIMQEDDEEEECVRRSSRKRRPICDTLNQSYLVSMPGKSSVTKREQSEDGKDEAEDNDEDLQNEPPFSDMYSRVKRKRVCVKRNMYGVPINDESGSDEEDQDENTNNNNDDSEEEEEEEEEEEDEEEEEENKNDNQNRRVLRDRGSLRPSKPQQRTVKKTYSLRQHKPTIDRYKPPEEKRRVRKIENSVFASTPTKNNVKEPYQSPARRRNVRKRSAFHSSSSSTSSSDSESSDEKNFKRRKAKSMAKARNRMMPMNMTAEAMASASVLKDRVKSGVSLADVEPMSIDKSVTFESIGGLGKHIRKLKEMVVFPLLYDNVFQRFKVDPPRGVLFYGPPGTGKTLVARALANECSQGDRRVAFFMRKGADCLSKWVGESERQLRLLFDQAYKFRPSIIFFDEIDGLAPVRSSRQDQIHSSIVSTLLALMDGLDSRGEIVVIGATNRIDSLDPALRRPGRFDREFLFPLPSVEARKQILQIHTSSWKPNLNEHFLSELAEKCVGYCGADLKALCTEAAMQALRRRYPQIYLTNEALKLDVASINVSAKDFFNAIASIIPTSQRSVNTPARALAARVTPLLEQQLNSVMEKLGDIFPPSQQDATSHAAPAPLSQAKALADKSGIPWDELLSDEDENAPSIFVPSTPTKGRTSKQGYSMEQDMLSKTYLNFASFATCRPTAFRPRLMLVGSEGQGQTTHLAPAIVHKMENLPIHVLDLPTLYAVTAKTPEESCANVFHEAKRKVPSIIYLPYMDQWWDVMADTLRATLLTLIQDLNPSLPLLLLATSERPYHMLDHTLKSLFSSQSCEVSVMRNPNKTERHTFFQDLLLRQAFKAPPQKKQAEAILNLLNETKRSNGKCNGNRRKSKPSTKANDLPNFIYPFGRHNEVEDESKQTVVANLIKGNLTSDKSVDVVSKLANVKLKLPETPLMNKIPTVKHIHRMVLRKRGQIDGGMNSNQSARDCDYSHVCEVRKHNRPAAIQKLSRQILRQKSRRKSLKMSTLYSKAGTYKSFGRIMSSKSQHVDKILKPDMYCAGDEVFKKPTPALQKKKQSKLNTKNTGKKSNSWSKLSNQLTSRHERYVRRLQRLEAKMSKIVTNPQPSESMNSQANYSALSARHLRYLRRLRRIDAALIQANSHCLVGQKPPRRDLSCGSMQMFYKRRNISNHLERDLSMPLNLKDLVDKPQKTTERNQVFSKSSTSFKRMKYHELKNLIRCERNQRNRYNLRKKNTSTVNRILEPLPLASEIKPKELSPEELALLVEKEELTLMELRIFLRDVLNKLGTDKKFTIFAKPVNIEDAADYYDIIDTPMDLSSMMAKIDMHEYSTVRHFLDDVDLICSNALEYNPDRGPMDRVIRHRACALKDTAYAIIKTELDKEFEKSCVDIQESRKRRGEKSNTVPNFYNTKLKHKNQSSRGKAVSNMLQPSSSSAVPSYLDKPQLQRTIPEPDGERFSRRVRGIHSDPVPPLEKVEKTYKSVREDRNNSSNGHIGGGDECKKLEQEMVQHAGNNVIGSEEKPGCETPSQNATGECSLNKSVKEEKKAIIKRLSSGQKGRTKSIWCKPKRKKRRLGLVLHKSDDIHSAQSKATEDKEEEEMSVEEREEEEEEKKDTVGSHTPSTSQQKEVNETLEIDTSESEVKSSRGRPRRLSHSQTSPATIPCGITRRSSGSPRTSVASALSPKPQAPSSSSIRQLSPASKVVTRESPIETDKDITSIPTELCNGHDTSNQKTDQDVDKVKALLAPTISNIEDAQSVDDKTLTEKLQEVSEPNHKPHAVKRLDLDLVITDSGHGSSLESNGDSRDSIDQKDAPVFPSTTSTEVQANRNHNCSDDLRTTAMAILETPSEKVTADVPRMTRLLNRLVGSTDNFTVERLEKIYSHLSQVIYRHRHVADKCLMIEAMERKVDDLTQQISFTSTH